MKKITLLKFPLIFSCFLLSCEDPKEPPIPLNIEIVSYTRTAYSIDLLWTEYQESDFKRYEIYLREDTAKEYLLRSTLLSSRQIFTSIPGLKPKTTYFIFIRILTQKGTNIDTKIYNITTFDDVPSPFRIENITDITFHSVKISWTYYSDTKAAKFDHYEIHYSTESNFIPSNATLFCKIDSLKKTSFDVVNLKENTDYYFKVRTYNAFGKFSESPEESVHLPYAPVDPLTLNTPGESEITESFVKLSWSRSLHDDFDRYEIHMSKNVRVNPDDSYYFIPEKSTLIDIIKDKNDTSYVINNLIKNDEYFFRIMVYDKTVNYSSSNTMGTTATTGGKPVPVELYDPVIDSELKVVILSWSRALTNYLKSYIIYMSPESMPEPNMYYWLTEIRNRNTTTYQTKRLPGNTTYYFRIRVLNIMGAHSLSNEKSITTLP
jgi:hypothetical protein